MHKLISFIAMYTLDRFDQQFLAERIRQFKGQVDRYLDKDLDDDKFRSLRLRNGLYEEKYAYMLRVAIPYGTLSSAQLRILGKIADTYDKGYGHLTTRQNIQFNWVALKDVESIFEDLASVGMSAIQTSGKVVRNITTDYTAGVDKEEIEDPRPYAEIIKQWFTLHPEFSWMAGKLKIAISGKARSDAAIKFHDVGLNLKKNQQGQIGFEVFVGGGLGSQPVVGKKIIDFLKPEDLLSYLESVLRIYNLKNRRDNAKKSRIKILVNNLGIETFKQLVEADWDTHKNALKLSQERISKIKQHFVLPVKEYNIQTIKEVSDLNFKIWKKNNTAPGKVKGFHLVTINLKGKNRAPGDISAAELDTLADIADTYSYSEVRTTNRQNIVLPYVREDFLYALYQDLHASLLANPYQHTIANHVSCPGADYCSLAKTSSITTASDIFARFSDLEKTLNIGQLNLNVSGCENSCAHHHLADIGFLGLLKGDKQYYQITLGGDRSTIGKKLGPSIRAEDAADAVESIVQTYSENRNTGENFNEVFKRIGLKPFKEKVYDAGK